MAQHFLSMAGADLEKVGREEFVPAKEFQMRWCRTYLSGYKDVPEHKVRFGKAMGTPSAFAAFPYIQYASFFRSHNPYSFR